MSHSFLFTKKSFRGFTLIELLVVIAIIGLLGTIISGPINNARNKAKDAKKIADLKNIQSALAVYADSTGQFPLTLGALVTGGYLDALPANVNAAYTPQSDKYMYVIYNTNTVASPLYTAYHLFTKLSVAGNAALDTDSDCSGATCAVGTIAGTSVTNFTSTADPGAPANATTDIAAVVDTSNAATSPCTPTVTTCVYDLRGNR